MDERSVLAACRRYKLQHAPRRAFGRLGDEHALHTGSSLEFHSYRSYARGDDPRRIDWNVYGRTERLQVKLFEAEIQPHVDVLLDSSASMAIADGRKPELTRELAAFVWHSARFAGNAARLHVLGETAELCEAPARLSAAASGRCCVLFEAPARTAHRFRPGGLRVLISDFLVSSSATTAIRELASNAAQLLVIMALGPWEANPTSSGSQQLRDVESTGEALIELSEASIARYLLRLGRLRDEVRGACASVGATWVEVVCDAALEPVLRRDLLPAGVVSPA
jgi:uncharacterized protein (DUF58 family)